MAVSKSVRLGPSPGTSVKLVNTLDLIYKYIMKIYKNAKDWNCKFCNAIIKSRRALYKHYKECEEKKKLPLDTLGRIKTPGIGKKSAETFKKKVERGEAKYTGHKLTDEQRKHLSEVRQKYLEENPNHGVKWYTVDGIMVQGTWEKKFAEYLCSKNIKWERKKLTYKTTHKYTPDFYCPEQNVYFEIKGFRRDRDLYKMYLVLEEYPDIKIKMIEKEELDNLETIDIFNLPNFNEKYKFEDIDQTKFINIW